MTLEVQESTAAYFANLACSNAALGSTTASCSGSQGAFDFWFLSESKGTFDKLTAVPVPGVIGLMGIGLLSLGMFGGRRRKA